jgi:membrane fusion protein (multidrug efflux system)
VNKNLTLKVLIISTLFLLMIGAGYWYWRNNTLRPSTDDAYVQGNIVNIAAQVPGPVSAIYVKDHEAVKKGQALFDILPTSYQAALEQAEAQLIQAEKNAARITRLVALDYAPKSAGDDATAALEVAKAAAARAKLNLEFTHVIAPADGTLVNFTLRVGSAVAPNFILFSLVEDNQWWIDANYKETQLTRIHPGQTASIRVDLYSDHVFRGHVEQISRGSGSAFSLLPPENATGNWVKVTQRFPVKIVFDTLDSHYPMRVGASATVTIDTTKK